MKRKDFNSLMKVTYKVEIDPEYNELTGEIEYDSTNGIRETYIVFDENKKDAEIIIYESGEFDEVDILNIEYINDPFDDVIVFE